MTCRSLWHSYKPTICDLSKMRRFMASVFHGFAEVRCMASLSQVVETWPDLVVVVRSKRRLIQWF